MSGFIINNNVCYQFRILRNLRIDIKDRLEEYSQSIEIDIHACTQRSMIVVRAGTSAKMTGTYPELF